jgi:nitronate monooxygenase
MYTQTKLTEMLDIRYPIIQAPMAGGPTTPQLIAAVSNSGGLGSLGAGYMAPDQIRSAVREVRTLSNRPFAANVFVLEPVTAVPEQIERINSVMQPYRSELGLEAPASVIRYVPTLDEQLAIILKERAPILSFTFGVLPTKWMQALKAAGVVVIGTATTVREAIALEQAGVDAVVGQGSEAGGHRGTFLGPAEDGLIGTMALIPQLVDAVNIPVIAAGGLMDGRGLAAALTLGAAGVQLGTAFLTCPESGAHPKHKECILQSTEQSSVLTRAFSGKSARGIKNRFVEEMDGRREDIPAYPLQNKLTRDIRQAAGQQNRTEFMSLWAGQGTRLSTNKPAGQLVADIVAQAEAILTR